MSRHLRLGEYLVGVEGIALMRYLFSDDSVVAARMAETRRIVCGDEDVYQLAGEISTVDPGSGYARWSETYDSPGNPLIHTEQPVVWSLLEALTPGEAVDVACGTGRHTRRLVELGHQVVGVDGSPEMLAKARASLPQVTFHLAQLTALPLESSSFDLVVCSLALEHVPDLNVAVAELRRVLRPGGRMVLSDLHPSIIAFGGVAYFQDASGAASVVRGYDHLHGDYLRAFEHAGLTVRQCLEPRMGPVEAAMQSASDFVPDAAHAAYVGVPGALIWELSRSS